jgi:hypothetical protein
MKNQRMMNNMPYFSNNVEGINEVVRIMRVSGISRLNNFLDVIKAVDCKLALDTQEEVKECQYRIQNLIDSKVKEIDDDLIFIKDNVKQYLGA